MVVASIQSGSNGNCYYYESNQKRIIIDAGISFSCLSQRCKNLGVSLDTIHGLFITHDHSDHIRSAGIFQRKTHAPLYISKPTLEKSRRRLGTLTTIEHFVPNDTITIEGIRIESFRTPHDGVDGSIFIVDDGRHRVGFFTDLGYSFDALKPLIGTVDVLFLESNYDETMLAENPTYPYVLKSRIRGDGGHLDNIASARLVKEFHSDRLRYLFLSHLSEQNNTPQLALSTHLQQYNEENPPFSILLASRYEASPVIHL